MDTAHRVGFKTTATIMYGHVEQPEHWARHLLRIRAQQKQTGGFTEFVPLPFVHMEAPMYLKGRARRGPTFREAVLMHAVARLALHPVIPNIQASWVKMGHEGVMACLNAGCNDLGGTLMNESITRAAGAAHGQETSPEEMHAMIHAGAAHAAAAHDAVSRTHRPNASPQVSAPANSPKSSTRRCANARAARISCATKPAAFPSSNWAEKKKKGSEHLNVL